MHVYVYGIAGSLCPALPRGPVGPPSAHSSSGAPPPQVPLSGRLDVRRPYKVSDPASGLSMPDGIYAHMLGACVFDIIACIRRVMFDLHVCTHVRCNIFLKPTRRPVRARCMGRAGRGGRACSLLGAPGQ